MVRRLLLVIGLCLCSVVQAEPEGQFYFIGKAAHDGSVSASGTGKTAVYLRWDALDGQLPAEVDRVRLSRNGTALVEFSRDALMTTAQIKRLYQGDAQEQRWLETMGRLHEAAAISGQNFDPQQFADYLHNQLQTDRVWSYLAARHDFNIARARNRAYLDYPGNGQFEYELRAYDAAGQSARLGLVSVDTATPQPVGGAAAPREFKAVRQAVCDVPETGKDHYTVALDWEAPGSSITDQFASQITVAAYDLYRGMENLAADVTVAPSLDIAALARQAKHDEKGQVVLPGLEKVNEVPVMVNASGDDLPAYLETQDVLQQAGLKPGDRRAYYLVARDFAGHYSATAATIVEVPDLIRPATPWNVWLYPGLVDDAEQMVLQWDAINLTNYRRAYANTQQFCNLDVVGQTGTLEVVEQDQNCTTDTHRSLKVDAADYLIYRFETFDAASRFKDSDGDGIADRDEAGNQCATANPAQYGTLLDTAAIKLASHTLKDGREVIRVQDPLPAQNKNDVYWYRIAARSVTGQLSYLSEPVRGLYPDTELPPQAEPVISVIDREPIGCELEVVDPNAPWQFEDAIKLSTRLDMQCEKETNIYPAVAIADFAHAQGSQCLNTGFKSKCQQGRSRQIAYRQDNDQGEFSCLVEVDSQVPGFCDQGHVRLKLKERETKRVITAETQVEQAEIKVPHPEADTCASLFQNIGGRVSRVASSCDDATKVELTHTLDRGTFCGFAVIHDEHNNISPPAFMPCIDIADKEFPEQLSAPQPVGLTITDTQAVLEWRQPSQAAASILIELSRTKPAEPETVEIISRPVAQIDAENATHTWVATLQPALADIEEWCVRFKTIGQQRNASVWSASQCTQRTQNNAVSPENLPWPKVSRIPQGEALVARYAGDLQPQRSAGGTHLLIELSEPVSYDKECQFSDQGGVNGNGQTVQQVFAQVVCSRVGKLNINQFLGGKLNFIVYRQQRNAQGQLGAFIQVSPVIEWMHWDKIDPEVVLGSLSLAASANDPYVKAFREDVNGTAWRWAFVDQYPYLSGHDYRYQLVYRTAEDELKLWRQTNWVTTPAASGLSGEGS